MSNIKDVFQSPCLSPYSVSNRSISILNVMNIILFFGRKKKMKKLCLLIALFIGFTAAANADVYQAGADRLTALQNNDGGWDWTEDGVPTTTSPKNTIAPIAMGLAKAYKQTGNSAHLAALTKAGSFLLSKSGTFSAVDGYLAAELDSVYGGTTYSDYVKANFYDKLSAGTYQRAGDATLYTTETYINRIRTNRSGTAANMGAWDIGMGLYAAVAIGASDTKAWITATTAEIDELSTDNYYDVVGLSGAILGLAAAGVDYDPQAGSFASASSIADLAGTLASYQLSNGAFTWNSYYVGDGNDAVQETAYAILALKAVGGFDAEVAAAQNYLISAQLTTGGWASSMDSTVENHELTGEALWAIPEPATMSILALGSLALLRKRK
jgi:hypothetical protein